MNAKEPIRIRRLYHEDPELRTFTASIVESRSGPKGLSELVLDRTAFYPTGGGQPNDVGVLAGREVVDVIEEGETVIHRVRGPAPEGEVEGKVDWEVRLDHRQQHTGQHILSRALVDGDGVNTIGFHLGKETCSIDLDRIVGEEELGRAEVMANEIVMADVPIEARWYEDPSDATPCCGTHCTRSGQVGPIKVLRWERRRGGTRVEFVCGGRALADYGRRLGALRTAALAFTTEELLVPDRVTALQEEAKELRSRLEKAESELQSRIIEEWVGEGPAKPLMRDVGDGRVAWLASMARELSERRRGPVLLYSTEATTTRFALAVPEDESRSAGETLKNLLASVGGRGGGSERIGQGAAPRDTLPRVLEAWADHDDDKEERDGV
jgi:alanyl-tRNA synthetase